MTKSCLYLYDDLRSKHTVTDDNLIVSTEKILPSDETQLDLLVLEGWVRKQDSLIVLGTYECGKIWYKSATNRSKYEHLLHIVVDFEKATKGSTKLRTLYHSLIVLQENPTLENVRNFFKNYLTILNYGDEPRAFLGKEQGQFKTLVKLYPEKCFDMIQHYLDNSELYGGYNGVGGLLFHKDKIETKIKKNQIYGDKNKF
jgi:hypothetical protein